MSYILNMFICVCMILLDNLLQCLLFIAVIDLSRIYDCTAILIYNVLVMFMIYPLIKIKLKILIFSPISLHSHEHMLIFSCISPPLPAASCDPVSVQVDGVCIEDWRTHLSGNETKVTLIFHRLITAMVIYGLMEMAFLYSSSKMCLEVPVK
jgi:hypothetical protein